MAMFGKCSQCEVDIEDGERSSTAKDVLVAAAKHAIQTGHLVRLKGTAYWKNKVVLVSAVDE